MAVMTVEGTLSDLSHFCCKQTTECKVLFLLVLLVMHFTFFSLVWLSGPPQSPVTSASLFCSHNSSHEFETAWTPGAAATREVLVFLLVQIWKCCQHQDLTVRITAGRDWGHTGRSIKECQQKVVLLISVVEHDFHQVSQKEVVGMC